MKSSFSDCIGGSDCRSSACHGVLLGDGDRHCELSLLLRGPLPWSSAYISKTFEIPLLFSIGFPGHFHQK